MAARTSPRLKLSALTFPDDVLRLAVSLERLSEHPLAQSIVRAADAKNVREAVVDSSGNVAGKGIKGRIDNAAVLVGNPRFMGEEGIKLDAIRTQIDGIGWGETVVVVARNGEPVGIIAIADTLKSRRQGRPLPGFEPKASRR